MSGDKRRVLSVKRSSNPDEDTFWKEYHKTSINESLGKLDDRSQFMITTCAGLIVADFGLNILLNIQGIISILPQILFVMATLFFVLSYFPRAQKSNKDRPVIIRKNYQNSFKWKIYWQYAGYGSFILGLIFILISNMYQTELVV